MSAKKPVLITGAAGFVGARFVESCSEVGHEAVSVDDSAYFETRPEHRGVNFQFKLDSRDLIKWLGEKGKTLHAIVHLGANTDTTDLRRPEMMENNFELSRHLWDFCTANQIPFVYASSAAIYGDGEFSYEDDDALIEKFKPLNPYAESKLLFDKYVLEQEKLGKTPPSWSGYRFFNVYGFGETHKGRMCSVARQAIAQVENTGTVRLFKSHKEGIRDGEQKRDFVYVDDVVKVLWFALEKPIKRGIFNLGSGQARTFVDFVKPVFKEFMRPEKIEFFDMPAAIQPRYQYFTEAPMQRLRGEGYPMKFSTVEQGVQEYVERYLEWRSAHA